MKVSDLMTRAVKSCAPDDNLNRAAQIMWENDCGVVPVVDGDNRVVGMITDRDICMAAYTQGPLWGTPVSATMAKRVHSVRETDSLDTAEALMSRAQVRRLPVLDGEGRLRGILSMNDLARHSRPSAAGKSDELSGDSVVQTLAAISEPHATRSAKQSRTAAGSALTA